MEFNKKVLCLGNNSLDTDTKTQKLAKENSARCYGMLTEATDINVGYYHSSIYDVEFGKLLDIIKQVDSLIVLDQPKHQWNAPDLFHKTIQLASLAEKFVNVIWLDETFKKDILFFENLLENNKSFCILPFIELLVQNGSTTVCCRSNSPVTQLDKLQNWQFDPSYKKIRDKMLAGELIPEYCRSCYNYEDKGIISARKKETMEWTNRLNLTSIEDILSIKSPVYYEVRASNTCNIQCRTCSPANSNLIEKEYIKLGLHNDNVTYKYTNFNFIDFTNLKSLYVAGGEPTAMPELYDFLEKCVDKGNVNFEFTINTNAVKFSDKLKNLIKHFTNLKFIVSIDGYQEVNDYVRWPSKWNTIVDNTHYLIKNGHKVILHTVVSIWTISRLHQLLKFFDQEFPDSLAQAMLAESENDVMNPFNFPNRELIKKNLNQIIELRCYQNDLVLQSFINSLINYYDNPLPIDYQKLKQFFEFNDKLDKSRNIRLMDYIPELDKFKERPYNTV